ncbi:MAG: hypothetical protein BGO77_00170 [Caedibacter sp. 37-49]|nr:MAG: hypothetical protein BGO77_00170 [Caedibacter sp. 37-49]
MNKNFLAAIDLGSNTCRLIIGKKDDQHLDIIEVFSRNIRLGEGLTKTGKLNKLAMKRAFDVLEICAKRLSQHTPLTLRAVATEACRRAQNGADFVKQVFERTGIQLEIVSQQQEALLALKGCASVLNPNVPYAILFDIGGASTEVLWVEIKKQAPLTLIDYISLPFGVVTLAEEFPQESAKSYSFIERRTRELLVEFSEKNKIQNYIEQQKVQLIGSSGTATTTAALHLGLKRYQRERVDGLVMTLEEVFTTIKFVQMMTLEERTIHQCIGAEREDLILGGMAILEAICKLYPVNNIGVTDRGVREGILTELAFGSSHLPFPAANSLFRVAS